MHMTPTLTAHFHTPGFFRVTASYLNGAVTRYTAPHWWYAAAWARARRKGGGAGYVLDLLQKSASELEPECIHEGHSMVGEAERHHRHNLTAHAGNLAGSAESLNSKRVTS